MSEIRAHLTKEVGGTLSDDGKYGLIKFVRERPDTLGNDELWVGVPTVLLPYLAAEAIRIFPQPEPGLNAFHPAVLKAEFVQVGGGPDGQIALTMTLDQGASLSFDIDRGQAEGLAEGLAIALGTYAAPPPPGGKLS